MTTLYEGGRAPQITARHRLRIAREEAGYDQTALAKAIGVSRNTVNNAELGKNEPRKIVLNAWALACGVPVSWVMTGIEPENGPPGGGQQGNPDHGTLDYHAEVCRPAFGKPRPTFGKCA